MDIGRELALARLPRPLPPAHIALRVRTGHPPAPPLGYSVTPYADAADQPKLIATMILNLLKQGFRHSDIVILSLRGLNSATLADRQRVDNVTLGLFTGNYDMMGNQLFEKGQVRFDTAIYLKNPDYGKASVASLCTDRSAVDSAHDPIRPDPRTGRNGQHGMVGLFRQFTFGASEATRM